MKAITLPLFKIIKTNKDKKKQAPLNSENPEIREESVYKEESESFKKDAYLPQNSSPRNRRDVYDNRNADIQDTHVNKMNVVEPQKVINSSSSRGTKSPLAATYGSSMNSRPSTSSAGVKAKPIKQRTVADNTDEYDTFLSLVGSVTGIRPKRMNAKDLQDTLEDLYTARFIKDTSYFKAQLKKGNNDEISDKSFPQFVYDFYKKKNKGNKKLIQTNCNDLLWSVEFHKKQSVEAELFAKFLSEKYDTRELVFFLYVRCLLEKELAIKFSGYGKIEVIKTTDPRSLNLNMKTCRKIAQIFFEQDDNELNAFLQIVQDKIDQNFNETGDKKIQCTKYLLLLLEEFHASKNTNRNMGGMQNNVDDENENDLEPRMEEIKAHPPPVPSRDLPVLDDLDNEDALELMKNISNHINDNRISQLISFMLESVLANYDDTIQTEILNMLKEEIKDALFTKITDMLKALHENNVDEWLRLLMIEDPTQQQVDYFDEVRDLIVKTSKLGDKITLDNIDDIAKKILQTKELKLELGKLVATLIEQVKNQS